MLCGGFSVRSSGGGERFRRFFVEAQVRWDVFNFISDVVSFLFRFVVFNVLTSIGGVFITVGRCFFEWKFFNEQSIRMISRTKRTRL